MLLYTASGVSGAVALLAEGVGRNLLNACRLLQADVALLAEGVGRNRVHINISGQAVSRPPRGGRG